jgi:tetratricopeptide (TPR) repeat protein
VPHAPQSHVEVTPPPSVPPSVTETDAVGERDHPRGRDDAAGHPATPAAPPHEDVEILLADDEVDLTQLLEELKQWDPVLPEPRVRQQPAAPADVAAVTGHAEATLVSAVPAAASVAPAGATTHAEQRWPDAPSPAGGAAELDALFADMQGHTDDRVVAEQQLAAGRVFLAAGLISEAARAFERASLEPRSRFAATLALAELHKSRSQLLDAVGWYEQAAMAPVPDAAVKRAVLYDLAESLEALGETERALGVLLDLLSQAEDYRDARQRLDRLLRVDAGG